MVPGTRSGATGGPPARTVPVPAHKYTFLLECYADAETTTTAAWVNGTGFHKVETFQERNNHRKGACLLQADIFNLLFQPTLKGTHTIKLIALASARKPALELYKHKQQLALCTTACPGKVSSPFSRELAAPAPPAPNATRPGGRARRAHVVSSSEWTPRRRGHAPNTFLSTTWAQPKRSPCHPHHPLAKMSGAGSEL